MICRRCLLRVSHARPSQSLSSPAQSSHLSALPQISSLSLTRPLRTTPIRSHPQDASAAQSPPTAKTSTPNRSPPPATSTGDGAQPFSTPLQPGPKTRGSDLKPLVPEAEEETQAAESRSSAPAGTVLRGLNYFKNKTDPVAMEDDEYPDWLWTILDQPRSTAADDTKQVVDPKLYSKSRSARRKATKRARLNAATNVTQQVNIPIHEQSIDLPGVSPGARRTRANEGYDDAAISDHEPHSGALANNIDAFSETREQAIVAAQGRKELTKSMRAQRRKGIRHSNFLKGVS